MVDALPHGACLDDPQHDGGPRSDDQGTADESSMAMPRGMSLELYSGSPAHPVTYADHEAGSKQARPLLERDQRLAGGDERSGILTRSSLLAQRHDRKEAQDAYGDGGALNDTSRDIAEGEDLVHPLEDGLNHDGGADPGDDEDHLQERAQPNACVGAATDDVAGIVKHGDVEKNGGDRGDVRDQEQYARNSCDLWDSSGLLSLMRSTTGDYRPTWWLRPRS